MRVIPIKILTLLIIFFIAAAAFSLTKTLDVGTSGSIYGVDGDFSTANDIYLDTVGADSGNNWNDSIFYENPDSTTGWYPHSEPADLPGGGAGFISCRGVKTHGYSKFYVKSSSFGLNGSNRNSATLYLLIRYKDNSLLPSLDRYYGPSGSVSPKSFKGAGMGIWVNDGKAHADFNQWVKLDTIGGSNDHTWKSKVITIAADNVLSSGGIFTFCIGAPGMYSNSDIYGEVYVDALTLADTVLSGTADKAGFWPSVSAGYTSFATTGVLKGGVPFFPVGTWLALPADDAVNLAVNTGYNCAVYSMSKAHRKPGFGSSTYWGDFDQVMGIRYLGLPNLLNIAQTKGLYIIPGISAEGWRYWIYNIGRSSGTLGFFNTGDPTPLLYHYAATNPSDRYNGTYPNIVSTMKYMVSQNKNHPSVLFWYVSDESDNYGIDTDHTYGGKGVLEGWGQAPESVRWLYKTFQTEDPTRPIWTNRMGWMPGMQKYYMDTSDFSGYDRYPSGTSDSDAHDQVAEWAEEYKFETGNSRMMIAIMDTMSFKDTTAVKVQTYLAMVHGSQGIMYFDMPEATATNTAWWNTMKATVSEVNTLGLNYLHLSNSTLLGYTYGTSHNNSYFSISHQEYGEAKTTNISIHSVFRKNNATGDRVLIAVNAYNAPTSAVFTGISDLDAGTNVEVLFEGGNITSGSGTISASFGAYERHVYKIKGPGVPSTPVADLSTVTGYPNPLKFDTPAKRFKFINLTGNCEITIYNINGEKIRTLREADQTPPNSGIIEWDCKTDSGDNVSFGVYSYIAVSPSGAKKHGKVGIVK